MNELESLRIVHYPDSSLRRVCEPVDAFDDDLAALVARMLELMKLGDGVGLAAPQVGVDKRLFVMNPTGEEADTRVLINPVIRDQHGSVEGEEGCLSLPGIRVNVRRAQQCQVTAQDLQGREHTFAAEDLVARICQHETDHLNGVLIIDRMGPTDRIATRKTLKALEAQHRAQARVGG
jgi:peptide deformylase